MRDGALPRPRIDLDRVDNLIFEARAIIIVVADDGHSQAVAGGSSANAQFFG